jgi:hypothetical protein
VFSDAFLLANLAALKQAQGVGPEMSALEPARTRVLPDAGKLDLSRMRWSRNSIAPPPPDAAAAADSGVAG